MDRQPPPAALTSPTNYGLMQDRRMASDRLNDQLARLRREMVGLRQTDLLLFSQLNGLRQSIAQHRGSMNQEYGNEDIPYRNGLESSL